jgi:serine/threonine-protein kinase
MAEVFLARRRGAAGVQKRLVVKRIRPERAGDPRLLALFVKEARLSMDLVHANIVPVFDFGRVGDALFLAMEFVDGRDLGAALARAHERGVALDPVLAAHIGGEACQALHYAHGKKDDAGRPLGVVHRDVTPRNVLLSFAGEVKLADFGVAALAADDESGRIRGTPAYMSPEQARGEAVDARSDLFSLGLVLWEALAGARVYTAADAAGLLAEARAGVVPPLPASVPEPLRQAVARATQPRPEDRYDGANKMHQALDTVVVAARSARPGMPAPSQLLADWLGRLFDRAEDDERAGAALADRTPEVTFIDDGEAELLRGWGDAPGDGTMRSIAETVDEDGAAAPPAGETRRPRARARLVVAGAIAAAAVAAIATQAGLRSTPVTTAATDAPPAVPAAARAPTAAPAPPDASPPDAVAQAVAPPAAPPRRAPARTVLYPVDINAKPWARVYIDGKYADDTPFRASLAAGPHRVRFVNPQDGSTKEITIAVPRDAPVIEVLAPATP